MSKSLVLVVAGLGLAAGAYFLWPREASTQGDGAATSSGRAERVAPDEDVGVRAPAEDPAGATGQAGADERTAATTTLEGVMGVQGFLLPRREVEEIEKQSVRLLVKMHRDAGGDSGIADPTLQPPGTDGDSLEIKYGSLDVAGLQQAHASLRAILDWQDRGPFVEKELELLPPVQRRTMEIELEWLEQRILYP